MPPPLRVWYDAPAQRPERGLEGLRILVALLILVHPLHAFLHPGHRALLAQALAAKGLPWGSALVWGALVLQAAASLALLARRALGAACTGQLLVLGAGVGLVQGPYWYVVGGAVVEGHRGMEYSVLLMACLVGLWVGRRSPGRGLALVRVSAALVLATHPVHAFFDLGGLGPFGASFDRYTFGHGLALVLLMLVTQALCSLGLVLRRAVAPACLGHAFILAMGIWLVHWPNWFVVGPGADGMEYSVLLIACFLAVARAHWPRRREGATLDVVAWEG